MPQSEIVLNIAFLPFIPVEDIVKDKRVALKKSIFVDVHLIAAFTRKLIVVRMCFTYGVTLGAKIKNRFEVLCESASLIFMRVLFLLLVGVYVYVAANCFVYFVNGHSLKLLGHVFADHAAAHSAAARVLCPSRVLEIAADGAECDKAGTAVLDKLTGARRNKSRFAVYRAVSFGVYTNADAVPYGFRHHFHGLFGVGTASFRNGINAEFYEFSPGPHSEKMVARHKAQIRFKRECFKKRVEHRRMI